MRSCGPGAARISQEQARVASDGQEKPRAIRSTWKQPRAVREQPGQEQPKSCQELSGDCQVQPGSHGVIKSSQELPRPFREQPGAARE